jgi:hypothetical protein
MAMGKLGRPKKGKSPWVTTPEILEQLNCSRSHLYRLRDEQFNRGYHYRDIRGRDSVTACYRWHSQRIETLLDKNALETGE